MARYQWGGIIHMTVDCSSEITKSGKSENLKKIAQNENKNKTSQNQSGTAKAVLGGKFITLLVYDNKKQCSQVNITSHPKNLEKEQNKSETSRKEEIIKIRSQ